MCGTRHIQPFTLGVLLGFSVHDNSRGKLTAPLIPCLSVSLTEFQCVIDLFVLNSVPSNRVQNR